MNLLQNYYNDVVRSTLLMKFGYLNNLQTPKINKIVINLTTKEVTRNTKLIYAGLLALELISGQKATVSKAKKSIASFKIHKGMLLGGKVTLRRENMYVFLTKLATINLPKIRDFKGLSTRSFNKHGNFSFGIPSLLIFPEVEAAYEYFPINLGLSVTIETNAKTLVESQALVSHFNLPFKYK